MTHDKALARATAALLAANAHTATVYLSEKETVRVTRRLFHGRPSAKALDLTVTIGKPNYKARAFIKLAVKAGERFPIRRVQLSFAQGQR